MYNKNFKSFYKSYLLRHPEYTPKLDGNDAYCNICGSVLSHFGPMKSQDEKISTRFTYCPICLSLERHRFEFNFLLCENLNKCNILHFTPELSLRTYLEQTGCNYYPANIDGSESYKVDITNIPFKTSYFDYIICNHILEHIEDDMKALHELYRVLKKDGKVFLTVPIYQKSLSLPPIALHKLSNKDRIKLFHQEDHLRNYSINLIKERIVAAGFKLKEHNIRDLSDDYIFSHRLLNYITERSHTLASTDVDLGHELADLSSLFILSK